MKIYKGITQKTIRSKGYSGLTAYPKDKWTKVVTFDPETRKWGRGNIVIRANKFYVEVMNDWTGKVIAQKPVANMKESLKMASRLRRNII